MDILYEPKAGIYDQSLTTLKNLGGEFQTFHLNWNDLEGAGSGSSSGVFSSTYTAYLDALNSTASESGMKINLRIHPVDVPGKSVPGDFSLYKDADSCVSAFESKSCDSSSGR